MRYLALAADFDGTLTLTDRASPEVVEALQRLQASGRKAILVTGRRLTELLDSCGCITSFDMVVAENGAMLYRPSTQESMLLAPPASQALVDALRHREVRPLEVGEGIVATRVPHETAVLQAIRDLGLELHIVFNRGAVMVLPPAINKATGLQAALREMRLSPHELVAVGDAENDHSFLHLAECSAAVSNAVESLKETADIVLRGRAGAGVTELIDRLIATDLAEVDRKLSHHHIALGKKLDGTKVWIPPYGQNILIAVPSGSGKSSLAGAFVEGLANQHYQVCIVDPEGDYVGLPHLVTLGDEERVPSMEEIEAVLRDPVTNLNVNLLGVRLADRPAYFSHLLSRLLEMRQRTSRPHWIVIDEAHHVLPQDHGDTIEHSGPLGEVMLVTVHPDHLAANILPLVDVVVAVGAGPDGTLRQFTDAIASAPLEPVSWEPRENRVACWLRREDSRAFGMEVILARCERIRHHRKYAMGELGRRSFYFRGPNSRLNLRASNLAMFCQIAEGVDDDTWAFHLMRGDYSPWLRIVIKDDDLALLAASLEARRDLSPGTSRRQLCDAIRMRYSLPA